MEFLVRELPSRRFLTTQSIPWAEPAGAVPFPSYLSVKSIRRNELNRQIILDPENDEYPITPVDATNLPPSWISKAALKSNFNQSIQTVELNVYPVNGTNLPPSWALRSANQSQYNVRLLTPLEIDIYPATPAVPEQPLTAFLEPIKFFKKHERQLLSPLELDAYPVILTPFPALIKQTAFRIKRRRLEHLALGVQSTSPGPGPGPIQPPVFVPLKALGVFSIIDNSGQGLDSLVDATGHGLTSLITPSLSVVSLADNSGQGLTSLISTSGDGVESDI